MRSSVDVHNFLLERGVAHELFPVRGRLRTPQRLAAVLDLPAGQVGHVVVFEGPGGPVAAVVPSDRRPDPGRVARIVAEGTLKPATASRASQLAGFLAEAIPPAGLPSGFRVVIDRPLAGRSVVYFPGGEASSVLKVRGRDLAEATGAAVASISERPPAGP